MMTASSPLTIAHWQDEYLIGDARIDQEHQILFNMVNDLHAAIQTAASPVRLQAMIQTMADHTAEHFQHEEALMLMHNYPGYGRHKQVHDNLLAKVSRLLAQFDQQEVVLSDRLTEFLTEWLAHHIRGEDQNMIEFLRDRND
ncbi:MAG: hemerythrin [Phormidesmis priestleyi Ana]|uniref:Hemerythrin n=1 Tax=Phormidesmis priestleyi Ana TaxID=1666911 RepID=A0A0P8BLX4_9CYAN|nr:MAG: hemerythrin [Phormidesmis priestleyi Ana]